MSGTALTFTVQDSPLRTHLAALQMLDAKHWQGLRREIGEFFKGDIQDNLDDQKLFDGRAMPQSKAAIARRGKTLIKNRHLYQSYTYNLTDSGVEVGSNSVYAAIHHFGGRTGRGHRITLPARPVLGMGARQERKLGDLLIADIKRTWRFVGQA